jgi:transposase-like protein
MKIVSVQNKMQTVTCPTCQSFQAITVGAQIEDTTKIRYLR